MNKYAIFFDYDNKTYRLPTNPEEMEISSSLSVEKYEVLKLGQVAVPTHMELMKYSFECEFPYQITKYVETHKYFHSSDEFIDKFKEWREELAPIRFIASNGIGKDINTLVLIEDLKISEKAGEEGDKYISFDLLEYKPFQKYKSIDKNTGKASKAQNSNEKNTKGKGVHVVVAGDTLWAIAKKYYGDGSKYTQIYSANKDKIKNPSLIYPGQKLVIP